ncbi:hypothetical protein [Ensifer canadensis]
MKNIIPFADDYNEFEAMSATSRAIMIDEMNREIEEQLEAIRKSAGEIAALIEANKKISN